MSETTREAPGALAPATLPNDFLTPSEVASRLRVSKAALYEWLARGDLPCYRLGRAIRIRATHLVDFAERRRSEPPARSSRYVRHPAS